MNKVVVPVAVESWFEREKERESESERERERETAEYGKRQGKGGRSRSQGAPLKFVYNVEISVKELRLAAAAPRVFQLELARSCISPLCVSGGVAAGRSI